MKNSASSIGEKIREERLKKNLTQASLAEGAISRNMLSLIEKGKALPSLETLEHIANILDLPAGYFLAGDETTEALYQKVSCVSRAKTLFREKRYEECADVCRGVPFDDELNALLAECELRIAELEMGRFHLKSASAHLKTAGSIADRTLYLSADFKGTVAACQFFISCAAGSIDTEKLGRIAAKENRVPPGFFGFLAVLAHFDKGDADTALTIANSFPFLTKDRYLYLKAKQHIMDFKYSKALELLLELEGSPELGFITKYRIYADIEACYENKREFENAYKYSGLKHKMLEAFTK